MIVTLGRSALHTKQGLCKVIRCADYIYIGVRGHATSMRPGS